MSKKKFYVVWNGRKKGIFSSWGVCKKQIDGFEGAQYKSFANLDEAETAFAKNYEDYKGKNTKKPSLSSFEKAKFGNPILESILNIASFIFISVFNYEFSSLMAISYCDFDKGA